MQTTRPNESTLFDLLRPLRARWWVVVVITAIAVAASLGFSYAQKKKYSATATLQVQDQTFDLGLVGVGVPTNLTAAEVASQAAQRIDQPAVSNRAKSILGSPLPAYELAGSVSASVDPNANNVHVDATQPSATGAAALANAFANATVAIVNHSQRQVYAAAAAALEGRKSGSVDPNSLRELRTLAAIATPAQLTEVATPPGAPSSPRPARNAALAALLGLMVGLLAAYLLDTADQKLRSSGDVERQFSYDVVGRVRQEALGHSPNAGAPDRIVDPVDWEQFRILQRNIEFLGPNGGPRTIAVTSSIPEEGKTTVACFVAFANAAAGRKTLLIECDLRRPVLAERLGIRRSPGLTDFATGAAAPEDVVQVIPFSDVVVSNGARGKRSDGLEPTTLAAETAPGYSHQLACVTAGSATDHPVEVLTSGAVRRMLDEVRQVYDVVILDTPPLLVVVDTLEVIEKAEAIVVCGRTAKLTRTQARAGENALKRLPGRPIGLVVTGVTPSRDSGYTYYSYYSSNRSD